MRIGIDVDGVLAELVPALIEFHNNEYGTNLKFEDFFSFKANRVWGGTLEEAIQKVEEFLKSHYFEKIQPIKESINGINALKQKHKLFVISTRQSFVHEKTINWLEKHFPSTFSKTFFANYWEKDKPKILKSEVCLKKRISILIEDELDWAIECAEKGIRVLLFDTPWNQTKEELPENIQRVFSWKEIIELI